MNDPQSPSRNEYDDEISLVDLAVIFVRRRRVFYLVFAVCVILGVGYAALADSTYRYTSLMQGAMTADGEPLTEPAALIASLEGQWLPEVKTEYEGDSKTLPFKVAFENPKDTNLIKITSETTEKNVEIIKKVHSGLLSRLKDVQRKELDERRNLLAQQLKSVNEIIGTLQQSDVRGEAVAAAVDRKLNLQLEISGLKDVNILVVSRKQSEPVGPRRTLLISMTIFIGFIVSVISAFFLEFASVVKKQATIRLEKDNLESR